MHDSVCRQVKGHLWPDGWSRRYEVRAGRKGRGRVVASAEERGNHPALDAAGDVMKRARSLGWAPRMETTD